MTKKFYDFIEIGTSNFDTLIETADDETYGISVEPIKYYLDQLPNKKNVKKINKAITDIVTNENKKINIFYIPESIINYYNLGFGLRGCNSINDYHPLHKKFNLCHLVQKDKVELLSIKDLFIDNNVGSLKLLKIDTEGHDVIILNGLYKYLNETLNKDIYPKKIIFESNDNTPSIMVDDIIEKFIKLGYVLVSRSHDTTIEYNF